MDDGINMGLLIGILSGMLPEVDPSDIESYVNAWLTAHPEATTTVQDGSITLAKLASDLAAKINSITSLSDDIDDVKSAIQDEDTRTNQILSLVNYGYDDPINYPIGDGSTWGRSIGVYRNGTTVQIHKPAATSVDIRVKLSGTFDLAGNGSGVSAWTTGLSFKTGHTYKVTIRLIGGSAVYNSDSHYGGSVSVYRTGESISVGSVTSGDGVNTRTFTAEENTEYNIVFYAAKAAIFTNAVYLITLEDLTESKLNAVDILQDYSDNLLSLVNSVHSFVDYNPQEYHAAHVEGSTTSTAFSIDRSGQVVEITGGAINSAATIKLSGAGSRTNSSGDVKAWTPTLNLKEGHRYIASAKQISGTFTDPQGGSAFALSLYKGGASASSGTAFLENTATGRVVGRKIDGDGTDYNLAIYIREGAVLTNLVLAVTVEDVTDSEYGDDYLDGFINSLHGLVNYGYCNKKTVLEKDTSGTASEKYVGVERVGPFVTLNYDGESTNRAKRVRISGDVLRASGEGYTHWVGNLQLTENKEYRVKIKKISGSGVRNDEAYLPTIVVYESEGENTIAKSVSSSATHREYRFIAPAGAVTIAIYIAYDAVLTNLAVECTLSTEAFDSNGVEDYYIAELEDTIAKVRAVNDEPSLVFPWVTDIHRFKASVQTFDEMIANMKYVASAVKCDFILNTGDTIEGDQQKDTSLGQAYDAIAAMKEIGEPLFYVEGNHDNNPYISSGALVFTLKQCFGGFFAATKGVTFNVNENGTDYYFDFDNLGVRIVSVNSCNATIATNYGFGNSTAAWLANALNTDHTVILMSHVSPIKEHVWNNINPGNAGGIRNALSAFVGGGGKLIILTGHSHVDAEFVSPYVEVTDVCQKFEQANTSTSQYEAISGQIDGIRNPARTASTYTADAWSMCVFKPFSNELDLIRFGAGVDRYIHCTPISSGTLTTRLSGEVTWSSSNTDVATVSDGTITVVTTGRCAIIAKDSTGNIEVWIVQT